MHLGKKEVKSLIYHVINYFSAPRFPAVWKELLDGAVVLALAHRHGHGCGGHMQTCFWIAATW